MIIGFIIGIHQSIYFGVAQSYWLFMLSSLSFLWLNYRLKKKKASLENPGTPPKVKTEAKKPKSRK
jgi:hypothetical protein